MNAEGPAISVVVPVRNDPGHLEQCLRGLSRSDLENHEVIVVDDASTDETPEVARRHGATLIHQERRTGPGGARNRGVAAAGAPIVLFIDADVVVHPGTLTEILLRFEADPALDALFGCYDDHPAATNFISQYRNLVHRHFHQEGAGPASTFWAGCGAIRRRVFEKIGGYRTRFNLPSIEDIELGARLHRKGGIIRLHPEIEVRHLKEWRFLPMVICDVVHRGIPWTIEVLKAGSIPDTLNLRLSQRVSAVLAALLLVTMIVSSWHQPGLFVLTFATYMGIVGIDRLAPRGVNHWLGAVLAALTVSAVATALILLSLSSPLTWWWESLSLALVLVIVGINFRYYGFFLRSRGLLFSLLVVPLHILYYLYSIAAFAVGHLIFRFGKTVAAER